MVRSAAIATDVPLATVLLLDGIWWKAARHFRHRPQTDGAIVSPISLPPWAFQGSRLIFDKRDSSVPLTPPVAAGYDPHGAARRHGEPGFARAVFPGEDPVGRTILSGGDSADRSTIIRWSAASHKFARSRSPCRRPSCACGSSINWRTAWPSWSAHQIPVPLWPASGNRHAVDRNRPVFDVRKMDDTRGIPSLPTIDSVLWMLPFIAILLQRWQGVRCHLVSGAARRKSGFESRWARPEDMRASSYMPILRSPRRRGP